MFLYQLDASLLHFQNFISSMSDMLRETLVDILPQLDDESIVKIITNISSLELRLVVQFIMFGRIPPGREEDSYIPTKGILYKNQEEAWVHYSLILVSVISSIYYML